MDGKSLTDDTTTLQIKTYFLNRPPFPKGKGKIVNLAQFTQEVTFTTDRYIKGKSVAMKLTGNPIDAPDIEIYFRHQDLKKILEFLIEQETPPKV